jgi:N-acetylneuraminate synthase
MEPLNVAGRRIGPGHPPFVIAEIGANHNGDMALCRRLIDAAKACGADAVKFQSWSKKSLIGGAEFARNTRYAKADPSALTLEQAVERYQLTPEQHREAAAYCRANGILFFSSVFSREEVDLLESLSVPLYKIASMDVTHHPLLEAVGRTGKPVLLSTGMASLGEIEAALGVLRGAKAGPVALLHCISIYPCPPEIVNLRNMETLEKAFDVPVGFSDHTVGAAVAIAAIARGACAIEKHFTVDKALEGWDHAVSADPREMSEIVASGRAAFAAIGSPHREISPSEIEKRKAFRRRAVAARSLKAGATLAAADLEFNRPGNGIGPDELRYLVGRTLRRDLSADEELEWSDVS